MLKLINHKVIQPLKSKSKTRKRTYTCEETRGKNALRPNQKSTAPRKIIHTVQLLEGGGKETGELIESNLFSQIFN